MNFRRYRSYKQGEFFVVFADTSTGAGDYCAAQFLSKTHLDVPVVYHSKTIASEMTPLIHTELEFIADKTGVRPVVCFERNNGGVFELERLAHLNRNGKYVLYHTKVNTGTAKTTENTIKYGWDTNSASRPTMILMLKEAIDKKLIKLYDKPTINEMFSFVTVQTSTSWKAQAEVGAHDDLIMALAGAWQLYQTEEPPEPPEKETVTSGNLASIWAS